MCLRSNAHNSSEQGSTLQFATDIPIKPEYAATATPLKLIQNQLEKMLNLYSE